MKRIFTMMSIACLVSCSHDKMKDFIPGTYVGNYQQEYSKGHDTLVFLCVSKEGNSYQITRHTGYSRIVNGKLRAVEHRKEEMTGIYDDKDKVIYEQRKGKTFSF